MAVEGRSYPVEVRYEESNISEDKNEFSYVDQCIQSIVELHTHEIPEDTLIFLPTEKDIRECCDLLSGVLPGALILPMFGRLAAADQKRIFKPSQRTKIVVATNVAETSITVPGIRYVIDSGLARISQYNVRGKNHQSSNHPNFTSQCRSAQGTMRTYRSRHMHQALLGRGLP